ncbi:MAG: Nuclease sbcCD subunit C, partial [Cyclobacteriaceae bacterium]|nr:Nuclease sbcCD subunit C [Cyclobacteriaceae bacterium]
AFSSVLTAVEYQKIQQEERNLLDKKSRWEESVSTLEEELKEYKKDEPKEDRDALSINYSRVNEKMRICQSERDELLTTYSIQKDRLQELERLDNLYKKEQKENEKWVLLKEAIGDSEGKRFSTFAQQLTLQHLTVLANKRLTTLTNRYILALPGESEDDDLIVLDQDMGMERRSVKTLSGGESFLISLSLALGLSDLASRNVNIESLFIDEGFGTLDPDALEQVLTTLEILQSETNKTIGVISHVSALKERIATRIEMVRAGQGFGKIMV